MIRQHERTKEQWLAKIQKADAYVTAAKNVLAAAYERLSAAGHAFNKSRDKLEAKMIAARGGMPLPEFFKLIEESEQKKHETSPETNGPANVGEGNPPQA